jgi:hypothetical protein
MIRTCETCKHHRIREMDVSHGADIEIWKHRCFKFAKFPGDPDVIGWGCIAETAEGPQGWPERCGPERKNWEPRDGAL